MQREESVSPHDVEWTGNSRDCPSHRQIVLNIVLNPMVLVMDNSFRLMSIDPLDCLGIRSEQGSVHHWWHTDFEDWRDFRRSSLLDRHCFWGRWEFTQCITCHEERVVPTDEQCYGTDPTKLLLAKLIAFGSQEASGKNFGWLNEPAKMKRIMWNVSVDDEGVICWRGEKTIRFTLTWNWCEKDEQDRCH